MSRWAAGGGAKQPPLYAAPQPPQPTAQPAATQQIYTNGAAAPVPRKNLPLPTPGATTTATSVAPLPAKVPPRSLPTPKSPAASPAVVIPPKTLPTPAPVKQAQEYPSYSPASSLHQHGLAVPTKGSSTPQLSTSDVTPTRSSRSSYQTAAAATAIRQQATSSSTETVPLTRGRSATVGSRSHQPPAYPPPTPTYQEAPPTYQPSAASTAYATPSEETITQLTNKLAQTTVNTSTEKDTPTRVGARPHIKFTNPNNKLQVLPQSLPKDRQEVVAPSPQPSEPERSYVEPTPEVSADYNYATTNEYAQATDNQVNYSAEQPQQDNSGAAHSENQQPLAGSTSGANPLRSSLTTLDFTVAPGGVLFRISEADVIPVIAGRLEESRKQRLPMTVIREEDTTIEMSSSEQPDTQPKNTMVLLNATLQFGEHISFDLSCNRPTMAISKHIFAFLKVCEPFNFVQKVSTVSLYLL